MNTTAKPFCLVLMPFRKEFDEWYRDAIQAACLKAGAYSERIDEQHFEGFIIERIYNQIAKADVIIGELSGKSVNVYYEVGYAHALGKRTILLAEEASQIPFDLQQYTHIIHAMDPTNLVESLAQKIEWSLSQPEAPLVEAEQQVSLLSGGNEIRDGDTVSVRSNSAPSEADLIAGRPFSMIPTLYLDLQNISRRRLPPNSFQIGLTIPTRLVNAEAENVVKTSKENCMVIVSDIKSLPPYGWHRIGFALSPQQTDTETLVSCMLSLIGDAGSKQISFNLSFVAELWES